MTTTKQIQKSKPFSGFTKFLIIMGMIVLLGAGYFGIQVWGDTRIGISLQTQPELRQGVMVHWTFDGKDMDPGAASAEVLDASGNGKTGNMINF
jgi:hypothetical protein